MNFTKPLLLAAGLATASVPALADGHGGSDTQGLMRFVQRVASQYLVMVTRTFVDLTYDSLTIEPGTNTLVLSGVTLYPELPWDENGDCTVKIDRLTSGDITSFETLQTTIEISGANMPAACLDPDVGGMMQSFGYDGLTADTMSIEISYDLPSSAADITVQASIIDALDLSIAATFDYLWFRIPLDGYSDEPVPVAYLGEAEIALQNNGLWERLEPMVAAQMGDLNAIPGMIQMMGGQALAGPDGQPTPEAQAFLGNLSAEVGRFLQEKNRVVVTVAPERAVLLGPDAFGSPADVIAVLKPEVSGVPVAYRRMIGPDELSAALGGGGGLDDDAKLRVGKALITGVGAPRSLSDGAALLAPLADSWNGTAALLVAQAKAAGGDSAGGYTMALRALAAGEAGAISVADELEAELDIATVLAAQEAQINAWPGAGEAMGNLQTMLGAGDVAGLRRMANAIAVGKSAPRDYVTAYYLASLAAAGGDKGAANLRERLDRRFGPSGDAWNQAASGAASEALKTWTDGLGAAIAAGVK